MHIPDGFLTAKVFVPTWIISAGGVAYSFKKASKKFQEKTIPLMGVTAAFVFAAQMINFPVIGGTSGHLLGGVLAGVLVGPFAGAIIMAIILAAQCVIFQDGGLTALGANVFNMAIVGAIGGNIIYNVVRKMFGGKKGLLIGVTVASWSSVFLSSICCAFELALAGTSPIKIVLPAMAAIHAIIGIGEAVITTLIVNFIYKVRPDLIYE